MLELVKLALDITDTDRDAELTNLIEAALIDLKIAGIYVPISADDCDPILKRVVVTYCKLFFGECEDYDRLKAAYDEQKHQLQTNSNYSTR